MQIKEQALSKSRAWLAKRNKSSSYDAPSSTNLDTSYSVGKNYSSRE